MVFPTDKTVASPNDAAPYAVLDYDSEEEFNIFFHRCRTDMLDTFKQVDTVMYFNFNLMYNGKPLTMLQFHFLFCLFMNTGCGGKYPYLINSTKIT